MLTATETVKLVKEKKLTARDYAPAFFLLLAVSLSGLRNAWDWEVFAPAFFFWAVFFNKEGFSLPGGLWPWFFGWLGISSVFSLEPLNSLSHFSKYLVFAFFLSLTSQSVENSRRAPPFWPRKPDLNPSPAFSTPEDGSKRAGRAWTRSLFGAALLCASVIFYQRITGAGVYGIIGNNPNYSAAILAGAFAAAWVFMFSAADSARGPRQASVTAADSARGPRQASVTAADGAGETAGRGIGEKSEVRSQKSDCFLTSDLRPLISKLPQPLPAVAGIYGLLCAVFLAGIIAANSRGAMLASILAAAAFLIINKKWRPLLYMAAALALTSAIAPADWLSFLFKSEDSRAYARVWIWGSAIKAALERPFFGFGPGLFERAFEFFKFPYFNGISYYSHSTIHAHSEVLNLAAEAGLPAAALFLGAVFYSVKEKSRGAFQSAMKFCAIALFVQGAFDMVFYSGAVSLLFFGSLGFAAGGPRPEGACGGSTGQSRPILLIFGGLCVLGLASRVVFERDYALALRPGATPAQSASALRRALLFAPYDKNLLLDAARARLLSSGNYAYAAAFVENAAVFCPKDPRFPYLAAGDFIYGADAPAAYNRLDKTLALEPEFPAARVALARLLYFDGKLKAAAAQAAIVEKIASSNARPRSVYDMLIVNFDGKIFENLKKEISQKIK